jgi:hypothetical protein
MTKTEYQEYEEAVKQGLAGLEFVSTGACPGCDECELGEECTDRERELADEPHFSWRSCDVCNSSLGGDRHAAHGQLNGELVKVADLIAAAKLGRPLKSSEVAALHDGFLPNCQFNNVEIISND